MDVQNPYSAPEVTQTVYQPVSDTLFEYRHSSRNLISIVASLPLASATASIVQQISATKQQIWSSGELLVAASVGCLMFSGFMAYIFFGLIWPRVYQFRVDRDYVTWRTPWPTASD